MGAGRQALTVGAPHHVKVCVPDLAAATRTRGSLLAGRPAT
ncbi:hypothetical protein HNR20_001739 [Micromonospora parathelypteridis]|uniref:Uncharacterized protein n=1 Tax=Micromonospora parathelypteridis TaxID=1839617 RepID=A0A840VTF4_9ACTN|nr:hypothetical protein [Micromonospora parathelypteridis]